ELEVTAPARIEEIRGGGTQADLVAEMGAGEIARRAESHQGICQQLEARRDALLRRDERLDDGARVPGECLRISGRRLQREVAAERAFGFVEKQGAQADAQVTSARAGLVGSRSAEARILVQGERQLDA